MARAESKVNIDYLPAHRGTRIFGAPVVGCPSDA